MKTLNFLGNIDFENAPDISLSGPRSAKRKRKKSISISGPGKEVALTIKQVIKPPKMEEIKLPEIRDEIICEEIVAPEPDRTPKEVKFNQLRILGSSFSKWSIIFCRNLLHSEEINHPLVNGSPTPILRRNILLSPARWLKVRESQKRFRM